MTVATNTLRPGLLVSLKTSLTGNIRYEKRIIEPERVTEDGVEKAKWETLRTIENKAEHTLGRAAQLAARACITRVCTNTAFGLLCPQTQAGELEQALKDARTIADEFNDQAQLSRLKIYVIAGKVAPDDGEAIKAINSEVRELIKNMEEGVANLDVKVIRDSANDLRKLNGMLAADAAGKSQVAIDVARTVARKIVKNGEQMVDQAAIARLTEVRSSFLDLGDTDTPEVEGRTTITVDDSGTVRTIIDPD